MEVRDIHRWKESASSALKLFKRRAALAFFGVATNATEGDISKVYKKLALELHPDKGGDTDKFAALQEMRQRTLESLDKDAEEEKQNDMDLEQVDPDDKKDVRISRWQAHRSIVQLWEETKTTINEIRSGKAAQGDPQEVLHVLRTFVMTFVNNELIACLRDGGAGATVEERLGGFAKTGAEIIAVSAAVDPQSTHQILSTHLGSFVVAHGFSPEARRMYASLLWATTQVREQANAMLAGLELVVDSNALFTDFSITTAPKVQTRRKPESTLEKGSLRAPA